MKIVTAEQMRAVDARGAKALEGGSLTLMERAGASLTLAVAGKLGKPEKGPVLVLCGKGNNGGDGLFTAVLLHRVGVTVKVVMPLGRDGLTPDATVMLRRAVEAKVPISTQLSLHDLQEAIVVVDALLGTGTKGAVRGPVAAIIEKVNTYRAGAGVLAVDIPSGLDPDSGAVAGPAILAARTLTMELPKPCLFFLPAANYSAQWEVAGLGIPEDVVAESPCVAETLSDDEAMSLLPLRCPGAHKMSVGAMLVIAGSRGMTGAAAMACRAAYRSGAGLVRLALPESLVPSLNAALPEVVYRPMAETPAGTLSFRAVGPLVGEAADVRATLLGPGLSRQAATANAIRRLVAQLPGSLVVDADALTAMAGHDDLWRLRQAPTVITPHPGEMSRLLGRPVEALEEDRLATAREAAARFGAVVVFKGAPTVIAAPDGRAFIEHFSTPVLAMAGTGDVLAGSITALLAQGMPELEAAALAVFIGMRAAIYASGERGMISLTIHDVLEYLGDAIRQLEFTDLPDEDQEETAPDA